jgi:hypothetical protein
MVRLTKKLLGLMPPGTLLLAASCSLEAWLPGTKTWRPESMACEAAPRYSGQIPSAGLQAILI